MSVARVRTERSYGTARACAILTGALVALSGCGSSVRTEAGTGGGSGATPPAEAGATGAGTGGTGGAAGGTSSIACAAGAPVSDFFIEARVDGERIRAEGDVRAQFRSGLADGMILVGGSSGNLIWSLNVRNAAGPVICGGGTITLFDEDADSYLVSDPFVDTNYGCAVELTQAAPEVGDVIAGTFSGILTRLPGPHMTSEVTSGAFRARREADGP